MKEIRVRLIDIMRGKTADLNLEPEDIVYIPTSEHSGMRTTLQAVQLRPNAIRSQSSVPEQLRLRQSAHPLSKSESR